MDKKEMKRRTLDKNKRRTFLFTVPEWALERHIVIMAGSEPMAIKPAHRNDLAMKISRCNMCGMCCVDPEQFGPWFFGSKKMTLNGKEVVICTQAVKSKVIEFPGKYREIVECNAPITPWQCIIRCGALTEENLPEGCTLRYSKPWKECGE